MPGDRQLDLQIVWHPSVIAYTELTDEQIMRLEKYGFRRLGMEPERMANETGVEELLPKQ